MNPRISKELKRYNYLYGEVGAAYHEMCRKVGLSDSAAMIFYAILEQGDHCLLRDVCRSTGMSKQTINSALRKLEAENLVYLEPSGSKNKTVYLTESGKRLAGRTAGRIMEAENQVFASWKKEDVEKYLELTEAFGLALREKAKNM